MKLTWTEAGSCLPHIQCVTTLQSAFIGDEFIHFTSGVQDSASAINTSSFNFECYFKVKGQSSDYRQSDI